MKGNLYTLCFAAILGTVCALLLTGAARFTEPYRTANEKAEEIFNILTALKVPFDADSSSSDLVELFERDIRIEARGSLELYVYSPAEAQGETTAVAVRFAGSGLWGPIKGFLALEPDERTIRGLTFYKQEETPGLGGDIVTAGFRDRFSGKSIVDASGKAGIVIAGIGRTGINEVDSITGATMTCNKVQQMLNAVIEQIVQERDNGG